MLPRARTDHLLVTEVGEEVVIFDQLSDQAHRLNPTATAVWRMADGTTPVEEIAANLVRDLGTPDDPDFVWVTLDRLGESRLLAEVGERPQISRRKAMKVLVGVAAFLLPAVSSIVAPMPLSAQSGGAGGGSDPLNCDPRFQSGCVEEEEGEGKEEETTGEEEKVNEETEK